MIYTMDGMIEVVLRSALVEDEEVQTSPALPVLFLPDELQFPLSLLLYTLPLPQVLLDPDQLLPNITRAQKTEKNVPK